MIDKKLITEIVENTIENTDKFVVNVHVKPGNSIEVVIDSDTNVTIDDCVKVSEAIETSLNRDEEDFELTVFSAGLSEPLQLLRQYKKHIGEEVEILFKTGSKQKGILVSATEDVIELKYSVKELLEGKKRKQQVEKINCFDFNDIKSTKLIIKF